MTQTPINWESLRAIARKEFVLPTCSIHGPAHWARVERNAVELASKIPGADEDICRLFAIFHDIKRQSDGRDPQHGPRACWWLNAQGGEKFLGIDPARYSLLLHAIGYHSDGKQVYSPEKPTIAACWDADRLDLKRASEILNPRFFSSPEAISMFRNPKPQPPQGLPRFIYHGTTTAFLERIAREGIAPRAASGYVDEPDFATHPDFVYLSCASSSAGPMYYAKKQPTVHGGSPVILQIETADLDSSRFFPEQDFVFLLLVSKGAPIPANVYNSNQPKMQRVMNALAWGRKNQEIYKDFWTDCLFDDSNHVLCYRGTVPSASICGAFHFAPDDAEVAALCGLGWGPDIDLQSRIMAEIFARRGQPFQEI